MTAPSNDRAGAVGHTPGEWVVNPFNAQVDCEKPSRHGGLLPVCQMLWPTDERSEAETEANARLIAAAPDLYDKGLALLEAAERHIFGDECKAERDAFRQALSKARAGGDL